MQALMGRGISGRLKKLCRYYFSEKLPGSKVLAIEGGKLLTMAHLNPYTISVNGKNGNCLISLV